MLTDTNQRIRDAAVEYETEGLWPMAAYVIKHIEQPPQYPELDDKVSQEDR